LNDGIKRPEAKPESVKAATGVGGSIKFIVVFGQGPVTGGRVIGHALRAYSLSIILVGYAVKIFI